MSAQQKGFLSITCAILY